VDASKFEMVCEHGLSGAARCGEGGGMFIGTFAHGGGHLRAKMEFATKSTTSRGPMGLNSCGGSFSYVLITNTTHTANPHTTSAIS
jgi:hypothetical protein